MSTDRQDDLSDEEQTELPPVLRKHLDWADAICGTETLTEFFSESKGDFSLKHTHWLMNKLFNYLKWTPNQVEQFLTVWLKKTEAEMAGRDCNDSVWEYSLTAEQETFRKLMHADLSGLNNYGLQIFLQRCLEQIIRA